MPVPPPSPPQPVLEPAVIPPTAPESERYRITSFVDQYGSSELRQRDQGPRAPNPTLGIVALLISASGFAMAAISFLLTQATIFTAVESLPITASWMESSLYAIAQLSAQHPVAVFFGLVLAPTLGVLGLLLGIIACGTRLGRRMGLWAIIIPLVQPFLLLLVVLLHRQLGL